MSDRPDVDGASERRRGERPPGRLGRRGFARLASGGAVIGVASALIPRTAFAGEINVEVVLAKTSVAVGEPVDLEVRVHVTDEVAGVGNPVLPALAGVQVVSRGSRFSSSYSFQMGRSVSEQTQTFKYRLIPSKAGSFPMDVVVPYGAGKRHAASFPTLVVGTGGLGASGTGGSGGPGNPAPSAPGTAPAPAIASGSLPTDATQEVFLWPTVSPQRVYVGQQLTYSLEVYERTFGRNAISISAMPSFKDFYTVELGAPQRRRRTTVDNVAYQVHGGIKRALFPQKAGTVQIRGGEVTVKQGGGLFFGPRRGGAGYKVPGPTIAVEVLPLPAKGQPKGFRAHNVGRFKIRAQVDRKAVEQGEGLTLTVSVEGRGNLELVEPDTWPEIEGGRRFDPDTKTPEVKHDNEGVVRGKRSWEFLILADRPGEVVIPSHTLTFFNPFAEKYVTGRTKPITIKVTGKGGAEVVEVDVDGEEDADDRFASVMETERLWHGPEEKPWLRGSRWTLAALSAPAILAATWGARAVWRRYGPDEASRSRARRSAERKRLLAEAAAAVPEGEGFHPAVAALLQRVALERGGELVSGLTRHRMAAALIDAGIPPDEVESFTTILDRCDAARFGAVSDDATERAELLRQARALADSKHWRAGA